MLSGRCVPLRSNVLDVARGAMYAYVLEVSDGPERVINNSLTSPSSY